MYEPLNFERLDFSSILPSKASLRLAAAALFAWGRSRRSKVAAPTEPGAARADVLLQTAGIEECASFYERHFGLPRFRQSGRMIGLDAGSFRLFIDKGPSYGPVLEFFVADVAAAKQRLVADGCVIDSENPAIPNCYVRDPFGLIFNLCEAAEKPRRTGGT